MRKLVIVVLAVVFACSSVLASSKAKKEADSYKDKISAGFDVANTGVDVRLWASDSLGIEATAGMFVNDGFGLNLGFGVLLPLSEEDVSFYLAPRLNIGFTGSSIDGELIKTEYSAVMLGAGVAIKAEVFLKNISKNLSIGAGAGLGLNITINSIKTTLKATNQISTDSDTDVSFSIINGWVSPLVIRYYF